MASLKLLPMNKIFDNIIDDAIREQIMAAIHYRIEQDQYHLDNPDAPMSPPPLTRDVRISLVQKAEQYCLENGFDMVRIIYYNEYLIYVVRHQGIVFEVHRKFKDNTDKPGGAYYAFNRQLFIQ